MICPSVKICEFFFFFQFCNCWHVHCVQAITELCWCCVGEVKKKKKTPFGHQSPASLIGIGVQHVSDTGTLPKMACRCNLVGTLALGNSSIRSFIQTWMKKIGLIQLGCGFVQLSCVIQRSHNTSGIDFYCACYAFHTTTFFLVEYGICES